jgi:hypothetical protein
VPGWWSAAGALLPEPLPVAEITVPSDRR